MGKALWALLFCMLVSQAQAATNADEAVDERSQALSKNYHSLAVVFTDIFQKSAAFSSGAWGFSPAVARPKWGFNAGLLLGAAVTPIDKGLASRNNTSQSSKDFIAGLPEALPLPQGGLNLHLGLPAFSVFEAVDSGLRLSSLNISAPEFSANMRDIGLELRGNIFEAGKGWPLSLCVGFSADFFNGELHFSQAKSLSDTTSVQFYTGTGNVNEGMDIVMKNHAFALKGVLSRKFKFFNPYLGASVQVNNGEVSTTGFQHGTWTMTGPGSPGTSTSSAPIEGHASAPVPGMDLRFGLGAEFLFKYVYVSLNGEFGAVSGGSGGALQLGGKFR